LRRDHPLINLHLVDSVENALRVVSTGEIDAYAGNLAVATYQIEKNNFTNLNVAASTPYENDHFAIGVRSDWPELVSILNKGIQSLTQQEHDEIRRKWFSVSI
jgi:ABC-type amino acid transport substrate-binding protein